MAPTRNAPGRAAVEVGLDGIHQPGQHRGPETCFVQDLNAGVRGGRVEEGRADLLPRPAEGGVGTEELGAAVRRVGVGVHDAARQLAQLAHMADEQHFLKPGGGRHIQRVTNEVGALDHRDLFQPGQGAVEVIQSIVARGQDQPLGRTRVGGGGEPDSFPAGWCPAGPAHSWAPRCRWCPAR